MSEEYLPNHQTYIGSLRSMTAEQRLQIAVRLSEADRQRRITSSAC